MNMNSICTVYVYVYIYIYLHPCTHTYIQYVSWKLSPLNIKITPSLEVPATCSFFLCASGLSLSLCW